MKKFLNKYFTSFTYLNITQFIGALIDNIYKLLVVYFLIAKEGIENSPEFLATTGVIFVAPFLLFSTTSGTLADRYSKRDIIVLTKIFEVVILGLAVLSFTYESKIGAYVTLFLLATQSAFFGPSKYGIIPEIVKNEKVTEANGLMTSFTFLAIIMGTFLASFLTEITNRNFILCSIICTIISLVGTITSFCIQHTPPSGAKRSIDIRIFSTILHSIKVAGRIPILLPAVLGSAFFLFVGAYLQLNMIPFAVQSLHLSDVQGGYLFLITSLGIGTGSVIAGKISGKTVELGLVPLGSMGITLCLFALSALSHKIGFVIPLVCIIGCFGGIYVIPLDSYIQLASPKTSRGQMVAVTNFLGFIGVLLASGFLYLTNGLFQLEPSQGFYVMAFLTLAVTCVFTFKLFDFVTRFFADILSRFHFRTEYFGRDALPNTPVIYVCTHTAWNDALLLLGSQRRRIRFFIEQEQKHSKIMQKLYRLLRVIFIPTTIEPLSKNAKSIEKIEQCLNSGLSVCIFTSNKDVIDEIRMLKKSPLFQDILSKAPVIPTHIAKKEPPYTYPLLKKFFVPASVSFDIEAQNNLESKQEVKDEV